MSEEAWHPVTRRRDPSVRIQTVLYANTVSVATRLVESLSHAAAVAREANRFSAVDLYIGDCSAWPVLRSEEVNQLRERHVPSGLDDLSYVHFGENLGHGGGHNRLLVDFSEDLVLFINPDAIADPWLLDELLQPFSRPDAGIVEARQLPFEHPKVWNFETGETPWASMACAMVRADVLRTIGAFDSNSFYLHCDDVDFSWRARLAGYRILYHPAARVFHDKRLTREGDVQASASEKYYGAHGMLMLAYKYSTDELVDEFLGTLDQGCPEQQAAARHFRRQLAAGELPDRVEGGHRVAQFIAGNYASHRF